MFFIFLRKDEVYEKAELYGMISDSLDKNVEAKIGSYILLDEKDEARKLGLVQK